MSMHAWTHYSYAQRCHKSNIFVALSYATQRDLATCCALSWRHECRERLIRSHSFHHRAVQGLFWDKHSGYKGTPLAITRATKKTGVC